MSRYQAYPPPGPVLLAAVTGASMLQTVLVELGIVSADGLGGLGWIIARVIPPIPLSVLLTGPLFLGAVYAVYSGEWRKSIKGELRQGELRRGAAPRRRSFPRSIEEWDVRIFYAAMVLVGAGLVVVGLRGGLFFFPPFLFWGAGGYLMLMGVVAPIADKCPDEVAHRPRDEAAHAPRDTQLPQQQDSIDYLSLADFCDDDCDDCLARFERFRSSDESPGCDDR